MGMFDTVMVPCPRCGKKAGFQSKGGDCILAVYEIDNAPIDVLSDVNRHSPHECDFCTTMFAAHVKAIVTPVEIKEQSK